MASLESSGSLSEDPSWCRWGEGLGSKNTWVMPVVPPAPLLPGSDARLGGKVLISGPLSVGDEFPRGLAVTQGATLST